MERAESNSFEKKIWDAACVLRGNMDASEYKSVVLGLIFLKYISDRFDEKYRALVAEGDGFEEDIDEYASEGIFFVPASARWSVISAAAHTPEIGTVIDSAMRSRYNKALKEEPGFTLSQQAMDLLDIRTQYAPPTEKTETFGPGSLGTDAYQRYSEQAASTYRGWADEIQSGRSFSTLPDTAKDSALDAARKLAEDLALRDVSGGKFTNEDLSQWERWASSGSSYGVSETEAILFKAAYDMSESDKDEDGKTISGSKKENTLETVSGLMPWLTDQELSYLMANYWTPEDAALKAMKEGKFMTKN